ncbi:hypothetical protein PNEG_02897 [Pneumocystis murina B123]|uniref:SLC41A/MgtE integral membrane domain-containing protein n=1 Tax=Pneumocystis murina (strain B123) TaxID=1069680 RepID=M7PE23_PNEMU|nr:hypothetical protein PNEG_02897 [Pneumocystis murina B123]EMR08719.1 hypothetical protein PNEG_02897 [Pneumocystis murina B123]
MDRLEPDTNEATYELLERHSVLETPYINNGNYHFQIIRELILQSTTSLVFSVIGSFLTGLMLNYIKTLISFQAFPILFILIPILLNLIGCLEMNLTSRLSTFANMGKLDTLEAQQTIIKRNLIILQMQSIGAGLLSGIIAFIFGCILPSLKQKSQLDFFVHDKSNELEKHGFSDQKLTLFKLQEKTLFKFFILIASSIMTGCISSAILGALISILVILALKFRVDPDNILTPIASSFGDLISVSIFCLVSVIFVSFFGLYTLIFFLSLILLFSIFIITNIINTYPITPTTWIPLLISLLITCGSGILFEKYIYFYSGIAFMIPISQGLSGNIGCIYASRVSTSLQMKNQQYKEIKWITITTLFFINFIFQVGFLIIIHQTKILSMNLTFIFVYQIITGILVSFKEHTSI